MNTEIGKVIWFDRKKGFGFVKLIDTKSKYQLVIIIKNKKYHQ